MFAVTFAAMSFIHFHETPTAEHVLRYTMSAPENTTYMQSFATSPDGRLVAIAAVVNGKRQLWLRAPDALQAQPIQGTVDATFPFAQGKLRKIDARGGPVQSLCDANPGPGVRLLSSDDTPTAAAPNSPDVSNR